MLTLPKKKGRSWTRKPKYAFFGIVAIRHDPNNGKVVMSCSMKMSVVLIMNQTKFNL